MNQSKLCRLFIKIFLSEFVTVNLRYYKVYSQTLDVEQLSNPKPQNSMTWVHNVCMCFCVYSGQRPVYTSWGSMANNAIIWDGMGGSRSS